MAPVAKARWAMSTEHRGGVANLLCESLNHIRSGAQPILSPLSHPTDHFVSLPLGLSLRQMLLGNFVQRFFRDNFFATDNYSRGFKTLGIITLGVLWGGVSGNAIFVDLGDRLVFQFAVLLFFADGRVSSFNTSLFPILPVSTHRN
jgi:hypothetical protein